MSALQQPGSPAVLLGGQNSSDHPPPDRHACALPPASTHTLGARNGLLSSRAQARWPPCQRWSKIWAGGGRALAR